MSSKLIFEKDKKVTSSYIPSPSIKIKEAKELIPQEFLRQQLDIPSLGEAEVVRHYLNLAKLNFSVDTNFYPLGSCTMKYNPKVNEELANLEGFVYLHPYQNLKDFQGALELVYSLEQFLCKITGMQRFSLQLASGAHAELAGMLMIKKYHQVHKNNKFKVIIPDSAHGTNPATATMCGYQTITVRSNAQGLVDMDDLNKVLDGEVAAMVLTNPNTLGLFEEDILEIGELVHKRGGLLYYDGANFNPLLGISTPTLMGFDVMHLNLHKTFSTPHGSGGPGAAGIGVNERLVDFLPVPLVEKGKKGFLLNYKVKNSIGRLRTFYGNFLVLVRAYAYILRLGREGLYRVAINSTVNANYLKESLKKYYPVAIDRPCMHEVVFSCQKYKEKGIGATEIAKRLIDYGIHPPTIHFPLIVKEALMVEPTETESKETLDYFIQVMLEIDKEINSEPSKVKNAPWNSYVKRIDEVKAGRQPDLCWRPS